MTESKTTSAPDYNYTRGCLNTYKVVKGWVSSADEHLHKLLQTQIEVEQSILDKMEKNNGI